MNKKTRTNKIVAMCMFFLTYAVVCLTLILFNKEFDTTFWCTFIYILVTLVLGIININITGKDADVEEYFFSMPLYIVSSLYYVLECILGILIIFVINNLDIKMVFFVQFVLLVIYLIISIIVLIGRDTTRNANANVMMRTDFITTLKTDIDYIRDGCDDSEMKKKLMTLSEEINYSKPDDRAYLENIEQDIKSHVMNISKSIENNDFEFAEYEINTMMKMLHQRNTLSGR